MSGGELCTFHREESIMWNPPRALTPEEQKMAARPQKTRKFLVFLRTIRHQLLDVDFQQPLAKS